MCPEHQIFFITDQVEKGNVSIEYCPTNDMIGDYFTKPLQGSKFTNFRAIVLGEQEVTKKGKYEKTVKRTCLRSGKYSDLANQKLPKE